MGQEGASCFQNWGSEGALTTGKGLCDCYKFSPKESYCELLWRQSNFLGLRDRTRMDITHNMFSYTEIAFVERTRNFPAKVPGRCEHHPTRNKKTIYKGPHTPNRRAELLEPQTSGCHKILRQERQLHHQTNNNKCMSTRRIAQHTTTTSTCAKNR